MSDIGLDFPVSTDVAFSGLLYWYVFAPATLALCAIGWFGGRLPPAVRYAVWGAAGLCVVPFVLLLVMAVGGVIGDSQRAAEFRARHRTLIAAEGVRTLPVPAGAVLEYADETQRELRSIALPRPTMVANILLEDTIEPLTALEWTGELARDQVIGNWPCRAGHLYFTSAGVVTRCTLAVGHHLAGYDLPAGTDCRHDPATGRWDLQLPQDGPALRIAAFGADLPPGGTLVLNADGTLRRLYVLHEFRMAISGVALFDHIIFNGTGLTGELAAPTPVGGVVLPAGAVVHVDLATGHVEATTRSNIIEP